MEVVFLTLLLKEPSHGYKLIEQASHYGINPDILARGVGYKILRKLEMFGFVESYWDTRESGMPKRIYRITEAGKNYLITWLGEIKIAVENLSKLIKELSELLEQKK